MAVSEKATNYVAGVGVTLPAWEHSLDQLGTVATAMVPILSALWLIVQMVFYVRKQWKART
jgi:hypothetical protein